MPDLYKKCQHKRAGIGGLHCPCCNMYFGKDKRKLNKLARHDMKEQLKKEVDDESNQD